jgi:hypothetical protein
MMNTENATVGISGPLLLHSWHFFLHITDGICPQVSFMINPANFLFLPSVGQKIFQIGRRRSWDEKGLKERRGELLKASSQVGPAV